MDDSLQRDLLFLASSPPVISIAGLLYERPLWQMDDSLITRACREYIPPKTYRLGARFEALCFALIKAGNLYDIIYHGFYTKAPLDIPGEGDFLLRCRTTGDYLHVEVTIKFYFSEQKKGCYLSEWEGPRGLDTAAKKIKKLYEKQLRLDVSRYTDRSTKIARMIFWRGGFFPYVSFSTSAPVITPPCFIMPHAIKGSHVRISDTTLQDTADYLGRDLCAVILHRQETLSAYACTQTSNRQMPLAAALSCVYEDVKIDGYHRAIALMEETLSVPDNARGLREAQRLYVLPAKESL